jgi:hypothetical protein
MSPNVTRSLKSLPTPGSPPLSSPTNKTKIMISQCPSSQLPLPPNTHTLPQPLLKSPLPPRPSSPNVPSLAHPPPQHLIPRITTTHLGSHPRSTSTVILATPPSTSPTPPPPPPLPLPTRSPNGRPHLANPKPLVKKTMTTPALTTNAARNSANLAQHQSTNLTPPAPRNNPPHTPSAHLHAQNGDPSLPPSLMMLLLRPPLPPPLPLNPSLPPTSTLPPS